MEIDILDLLDMNTEHIANGLLRKIHEEAIKEIMDLRKKTRDIYGSCNNRMSHSKHLTESGKICTGRTYDMT